MQFRNQSQHAVKLQYLHKDRTEWSAQLPFAAGSEGLLEREHYFRDVRGLRVLDGDQRYTVTSASLRTFHQVCDRGSTCTISYLGNGRVMVQRG